MQEKIQIHASRIVIENIHEKEHPKKGESFEGIDDMPQFNHTRSTCIKQTSTELREYLTLEFD